MEICEFKAWFEGFTEDMTGQPNAKQWKRIKQRVKQVDGTPTTERVFIDRYWHRYEPYWTYTGLTFSGTSTSTAIPQTGSPTITSNASMPFDGTLLNTTTAFTALGKAEAASIAV